MNLVSLACVAVVVAAVGCSAAPEPLQKPKTAVAAAVVPAADAADDVFFERCPRGNDWINFKSHCYLFIERPEYWYVAEQFCKTQYGGNLVSIADSAENIFVSKLTYCQSAWTGRYAVDLDRLNQPGNYRWTDGTNSSYHAHDFTSISHIHQPLISIDNTRWRNNVYHTRHQFVCKTRYQPPPTSQPQAACPVNWKHLNGQCYHMPQFTATYIEADFYCSGRGARVASLHNDQEVRAISLLDLDTNGCPAEAWVGLVKLNPCRVDFSTGAAVCWKWADRSGDYNNFPRWDAGSPNNDTVTNCAVLKDRSIRSARCYERFRFACKKRA